MPEKVQQRPREMVKVDPDMLDPFASYTITSFNKKFSDDVCGIRFVNGEARVDALEHWEGRDRKLQVRDPFGNLVDGDYADPDVAERHEALVYFQNAHFTEKPIRVFDEDREMMIQSGVELVPTYVAVKIEGRAQPVSKKAKAKELDAPAAAAEAASAAAS